jgi:hypothetical protein
MFTKALAVTGVVVGSLVGASAASAVTLTCTSGLVCIGLGSTPTTVATSSNGSVSYNSTSVTGFSSVQISGTGNPPLSAPNLLDTTDLDVVSSMLGGGTLYVWVTETGITSPTGLIGFISGFDLNALSTAGISVTENTYLSPTNVAYGTTDQLGSVVLNPNGTTSVTALFSTGSPYSVSAEYIVTLTGGQSADGTIDISTTPIPGTLPLFASGLFGFWAWSRKRKQTVKLLGGPSPA